MDMCSACQLITCRRGILDPQEEVSVCNGCQCDYIYQDNNPIQLLDLNNNE